LTEQRVYSARRHTPRRFRAPLIALGALLIVGGAGAAAWIYGRPFLERRWGRKVSSRPPPAAVQQVVSTWKDSLGGVAGSGPELVAAGERLLRDHGADKALDARKMFQKAMVLDPRNDAAIVGYVRSLALGASSIDDAQFEEGVSVAVAAEKRFRENADLPLARAELLLARPTPARLEEAREVAEQVLALARDPQHRARAHLLLGRSLQPSSAAEAAKSLEEAITLDPKLRDAWYLRALTREGSQDYAGALEDLGKVLELEPTHWEAVAARARLFREVGQLERARAEYESILKKESEHLRARLALAALGYQTQGRLAESLQELRALAADVSRFSAQEQAEILVHLAAAERASDNRPAAGKAAQDALARAPGDVAAHLQLLLLAIDQRDEAGAEQQLAAVSGKLGDPAMEKLLEGRVKMLKSRWAEAESDLKAAHQADRRRVDALLLAGISAAKAGRNDDAFRHLFSAARADPSRLPPRLTDPRLYFEPTQLLAQYDDVIVKLPRRGGAANLFLDAVFRYYLGDLKSASRRLGVATAEDPGNALALAWRGIVGLRAGERGTAMSQGTLALWEDGRLALGHYVVGAGLSRAGKGARARRSLENAARFDPALLGPQYELAALEAKQGKVDPARERLLRILAVDSSYPPAKELLFALGKGAGP
jgi:cellulose synthase operon protein C